MIFNEEISKLPVIEVYKDLSASLAKGKSAVLKAPPGSGKSTAIPALFLADGLFGDKKILMLEPRRIACMMVARRIAYLLGDEVGGVVGYRMRGEKKLSSRTRLEIVTEGTFTRIIQNDMELKDYALIIFDEFHERNIHSDLGLALSLDVRNNLRDDLSLLVMSATLNEDELCAFLPDFPFFECSGRMYDLMIKYAAESVHPEETVNAAYRQIMQILSTSSNGNILVFLSGVYEITTLASMLEKSVADNVIIAPLHGTLNKDDRMKALKKTADNERKIVIATNIAESSVTIDDIRFVIDSGWEKRMFFNPDAGMDKLKNVRIAKSSAIQRAGRAGRTSNGEVYRLYTRFEYEGMADYPPAEIASVDLANLCLELAMWGCAAEDLHFLTPPAPGSLAQGRELLAELELLDGNGKITELGRQIGNFPGSCRAGKMFYAARERDLTVLGCELTALLEERTLPFVDICQSLEIMRCKPTVSYQKSLDKLLKDNKLKYRKENIEYAGELLFAGFPDRVGKRRSGSLNEYQLANGRIAVTSEIFEGKSGEYIIAPLLNMTESKTGIFAAASFNFELLPQEMLKTVMEYHFDDKSGVFVSEKIRTFYNMVIDRKPGNEFNEGAFKKAVLAECRKRSIQAVFSWTDDDENFFNRCCFAHFSEPENFPEISEAKLLEDGRFIDFLDCSAHSLAALKKVSFKNLLKDFIGYEIVYALDKNYPERYLTPGGSNFKIRYEEQDAVLAVPIAEMYGTKVHPQLGRKRIPLRIELLSPAMRPVQVTRDLPNFWLTNWSYVRKEMKQRYIKHFWPEDPANALPGRSIRR